VDESRLGAVFRSVRIRRRLRQSDVARLAGVSRTTVSRIERGHVGLLAVGTVQRVARVLEVRLGWNAWWRGGDLDRMLNAGHAALHEVVARHLGGSEWLVVPEASFAIYGERGVIDILCFHRASGSLQVVELKTTIVDVQGLIGSVDRYRRLAPQVAAERGWSAASVSCWVVLRESATNRRRLAAHSTVLRTAFPDDGRRMRAWLRGPAGQVAALSFLSIDHPGILMSGSPGTQRVRRGSSSVCSREFPVQRSADGR
jgi:transcriptional regulator with XRE-family HTH domain